MNNVVAELNKKLGKQKTSSSGKSPKIIVVCSGKGGVGKTFIASSLGITLSRQGFSTLLVDMDISGANIHTYLGVPPSLLNIRHFFEGKKSVDEIIVKSPMTKLSFIQGFWDSWNPIEISLEQSMIFFKALKTLSFDYIVLDISSGQSIANLEMLRRADEKLVITDPEPSTIERTYRLMEAYICHAIKSGATPESYQTLIQLLRDQRHGTRTEPFSLKSYINEHEGIQKNTFADINHHPLKLILNGSRSHLDQDLGHCVKSVCRKYFDLNIEYAGSIDFNNAVWQSARKREPVLVAQPFTPLAGQFMSICKNLVNAPTLRAAG
jgi:flagellar biosynthesis protein FlhG